MKLQYIFFALAPLVFPACDQSQVRKEAYEEGFADGQAAMKAQMTARAAATAAVRATPVPQVADPQLRRILPNSKLQGTALDQKPKR